MKRWLLISFVLLCFGALQAECVICIHGFMRTKRMMKPMCYALERQGYTAIAWGYPSRDAMIRDHSYHLVKKLRRIATEHPDEPIHFVTHSLGGIIVRAAVNDPRCPEEAKRGNAVLIAPPNKGSHFGRKLNTSKVMRAIVGDKSGLELFTMTAEDVRAFGPFPPSMRVCVIAGDGGLWNPLLKKPHDGKVCVQETYLETPHEHCVLPYGHTFIAQSKEVIDKTLFFF